MPPQGTNVMASQELEPVRQALERLTGRRPAQSALLAKSDAGVRHWAIVASLTTTAKLNGVKLLEWLKLAAALAFLPTKDRSAAG
jgi:hypothetical protein